MSNKEADITNNLNRARELAVAACNYDEGGNLLQAINSYDQAIIFIDEVLSKIPDTSLPYTQLMSYREKYNSRLVWHYNSSKVIIYHLIGKSSQLGD